MSDQRRGQEEWAAEEGVSEERGRSVRPEELPDEGATAAPDTPRRSVPIGRPISPADLQRMKERAGEGSTESEKSAQEDPSVRRDEE